MQVFVRDNDINSALRVLKKKMQREGTFREMKRRRAYEKPSERRAREHAECIRRHRKMLRKRLEREGILIGARHGATDKPLLRSLPIITGGTRLASGHWPAMPRPRRLKSI